MAFPAQETARKHYLDPESYLVSSETSDPFSTEFEDQVESSVPYAWDSLSSPGLQCSEDQRMEIDESRETGRICTPARSVGSGHDSCRTIYASRRKQMCIAQFRHIRQLLLKGGLELKGLTNELAGDKGKVYSWSTILQCWKRQVKERINELEESSEEQMCRECFGISDSLDSQTLLGTAMNSFPTVALIQKRRGEECKQLWTEEREVSAQFQTITFGRVPTTLCEPGSGPENLERFPELAVQESPGSANNRRRAVELDSCPAKKRCLPSAIVITQSKQVFDITATVSGRPARKRPGATLDFGSLKMRCGEMQVVV